MKKSAPGAGNVTTSYFKTVLFLTWRVKWGRVVWKADVIIPTGNRLQALWRPGAGDSQASQV
ncbi:MAG: hypothetical protein IKY92_02095, partial [Akkermansia sp.]|nr:hypothetical protein [Akkermansia sp.]